MQELIQTIELLLRNHNFIVVPGFGGFVAENESATEFDGTLYPPHKAIGFNPSITYNDGLIAQQYALTKLISFAEANRQIDCAVAELLDALATWKHLRFGDIGFFYYSDGNIMFEPSVKNPFLNTSFGLVPVYFPKIKFLAVDTESENPSDIVNETPCQKSRGIRFTPSRNWVAAAVAVVLFIVLFPLSVNNSRTDVNINTDKASFAKAVETIACSTGKTPDNTEVSETEKTNVNYHIIIGSFYSKAKAEKFVSELPAQYRGGCKILFSEQRYRVSYCVFNSETESDDFLESFSDNPRFRDAWILEVANNNKDDLNIL